MDRAAPTPGSCITGDAGRRAPLDLQAPRQDPFIAAARIYAVLHHLPDVQQAATGLRFRAPRTFVGQHHLADGQPVSGAMAEQVFGVLEREGQGRGVLDNPVGAGGVFVDHKPTADRVVLAAADLDTRAIEGTENHAVGVVGEGFADHRQVFFLVERNAVFAEQVQAAAAAHRQEARGDGFSVYGVRVFAFQAEQHGLVAAVAFAGGAQRPVEFHLDAGGGAQQVVALEALDKTSGGAHRADGVGTGGADANLEQVEHA